MQTVTSAENGGTEKADFQVPISVFDLCNQIKVSQILNNIKLRLWAVVFPKAISAWNSIAFTEAPSLAVFR